LDSIHSTKSPGISFCDSYKNLFDVNNKKNSMKDIKSINDTIINQNSGLSDPISLNFEMHKTKQVFDFLQSKVTDMYAKSVYIT
jgi:hypothetical protein